MKYAICDIITVPYPVIRPRLTLPAKTAIALPITAVIRPQFTLPTKAPKQHQLQTHTVPLRARPIPSKKQGNPWRVLCIAACQAIYVAVALAMCLVAYSYLAPWPVYRYVAIAIIAILWSNVAGRAALKKSIDVLSTVKVRAMRSIHSAMLTDTNVFLKSIKSSFLGHNHEIR